MGAIENNSVYDQIGRILSSPGFTTELVTALDMQLPAGLPQSEHDRLRQELFVAMVRRVARDVNQHPRRDVMYNLLKDWTQLRRDEFYAFLEFVQSCLVNHFKGELAELLAWPSMQQFAEQILRSGRAERGVEIVPGWAFKARRDSGGGWYKGADALFVTALDDGCGVSGWRNVVKSSQIGIAGVAEIKSSASVGIQRIFGQLKNHLRRLRCGLWLCGEELSPDRLWIPACHGKETHKWVPLARASDFENVHQLAIRPASSGSAGPSQEIPPNSCVSVLPLLGSDILEAAYRFAVWFVCQAGNEVYCDPATTGEGRVCSPHPEMTYEEAAQNVLRESLYHFCHQEDLLRKPLEKLQRCSIKQLRLHSTFCWLYNSICYGHDRARGDRIQMPEEHAELPRAYVTTIPAVVSDVKAGQLADLIEECRSFYRHGKQPEARQAMQRLLSAGVVPEKAREVAWLDSMIAYRDGRFEDALREFPGPDPGPQDFWWTRDQAMWARLHARTGLTREARSLLEALLPLARWPHRALPVEYYGIAALSWLLEGNLRMARSEGDRGSEALKTLQKEIADREARGIGEPDDVHVQTVQMGIYDLAAVLTGVGRKDTAIESLLRIGGLDGWEYRYLARDPLLLPLFEDPDILPRFEEWNRTSQAE